jgi:enoyl-CoA hydratase/carnithine racemase
MSIIYKEFGKAATISLNRPKYLNTLTYEMVQKIDFYLKAISRNTKIHLVIFKAEGDRAFCAGGDVKSFYEEKLGNEHKLRKEFFYK